MPESPTRELIKEERKHLHQAQEESMKHPDAPGAQLAAGHAEGQMRRAITIRHYEQVLDAALSNMPLDRLLPLILSRVRTLLECDAVTVFLLDADGKDLYATASVGLEQAVDVAIRIPLGEGIAGAVMSSGASQTLYDVNAATVANPLLVGMGIKSLVAVPIGVGGRPIGVLTAGCLSGRKFEAEEVRLLEVVAERVGLAIDRTRILELVHVEREKAERASRFKTTLMHMATHDIKTPLTTMKLQLALFKMPGATPESMAKAVAIVDRSITRLEMILDDFLDLARIEAGKFTLNVQPVDLRAVADEVVQMFAPQAALKGVELRITGDSVILDADERRLTQVIVNLVSNAIRYTNHGSVDIRVGHKDAAAHVVVESAQLVVQDTGRGMNREQLDRLFEPFGQVHEGRQQGSGLGLHLSKVIVDAHGGTIRIESPGPEQGATVTIELPMKRPAGAGAGPVIHPDLV